MSIGTETLNKTNKTLFGQKPLIGCYASLYVPHLRQCLPLFNVLSLTKSLDGGHVLHAEWLGHNIVAVLVGSFSSQAVHTEIKDIILACWLSSHGRNLTKPRFIIILQQTMNIKEQCPVCPYLSNGGLVKTEAKQHPLTFLPYPTTL